MRASLSRKSSAIVSSSESNPETWIAPFFNTSAFASVAKFSQNPELGAYLFGTGGRVLVEASPRDRIWGIGMGAKNENAANPAQWRGLNLLGFALMRARDILRKEDTIT